MNRSIAIVATLVVAMTGARAAANASLRVGDTLVYVVTTELQHHYVASGGKRNERSSETSAQGSETITIYAIGQDGTAYANVEASFKGLDNGQPIDFDVKFPAKVMPDGRLRMKEQLGFGISDAINFANTTTGEITQHALQVGNGWKTSQKSPYVRLNLARTVTGKTVYQSYPAVLVQTLGSGILEKTSDGKPSSGTVAVSGTSYYDSADHLLLGEALRTFTVVKQPGSDAAHDNYSAAMDVVLGSWTHAAAAPGTPNPMPSAAFSPTPAGTPTPGPVPSGYGPTPYPTVTPRLGY